MSDPNDPKSLTPPRKLAICATSARWLTESASRAGYSVQAFDQFSDWDLQRVANRFESFRSFSEFAESATQIKGPLLIGGGLESNLNALQNLASLAGWKNSPLESLRSSRDPFFWTKRLLECGFPVADVKKNLLDSKRKKWLRKSFDSTGGDGVAWSSNGLLVAKECEYFQEFIPGRAISSLHVNHGKDTATLGVFVQLVGDPGIPNGFNSSVSDGFYFSDVPFQFVGAIGPLSHRLQRCLEIDDVSIGRIATAVVEATGLRGIFGIDWVQGGPAMIPVEINPRMTATGELWEQASGQNLVALQLGSIEGHEMPGLECKGLFGKAVAFNQGDGVLVSKKLHQKLVSFWEAGWAADIPQPGMKILPGQPVVTVFSKSRSLLVEPTIDQVQRELRDHLHRVRSEVECARKMGSRFASH